MGEGEAPYRDILALKLKMNTDLNFKVREPCAEAGVAQHMHRSSRLVGCLGL